MLIVNSMSLTLAQPTPHHLGDSPNTVNSAATKTYFWMDLCHENLLPKHYTELVAATHAASSVEVRLMGSP